MYWIWKPGKLNLDFWRLTRKLFGSAIDLEFLVNGYLVCLVCCFAVPIGTYAAELVTSLSLFQYEMSLKTCIFPARSKSEQINSELVICQA